MYCVCVLCVLCACVLCACVVCVCCVCVVFFLCVCECMSCVVHKLILDIIIWKRLKIFCFVIGPGRLSRDKICNNNCFLRQGWHDKHHHILMPRDKDLKWQGFVIEGGVGHRDNTGY